MLVGQQVELLVLQVAAPLAHRRLRRHRRAHRQGRQEHANHVVNTIDLVGPPGHRHAKHDIVGVDVSAEGERPCGLHQGVRCDALVAGGVDDEFGLLGCQVKVEAPTIEATNTPATGQVNS